MRPTPVNHPSRYSRRPARVLVEAEDGAEAFARLRMLQIAGYDGAWCPGPERRGTRGCPLVNAGHCPMVDDADVVVTSLRLDHDAARLVLEAMDRHHPQLPVVIETTSSSAEEFAPLVGCHRVVAAPTTPADLVSAVAEALSSVAVADLPGPARDE
jgi:hypothetical protein